jgi:hypothetical protein
MSVYTKNPQKVLEEQFSPKEILEAFKNGDFENTFKELGEKLKNPFINIPASGQSLDIRRVVDASAGTTSAMLINFQPPRGMEAIITAYGIYTDAALAVDTEFVPLLNGTRVFPYHGTPTDINNPNKIPYRISLGLGPDLSNESMIECNLRIQDTQTFQWFITNSSALSQVMGVRFKGFLRSIGKAQNYKIGG